MQRQPLTDGSGAWFNVDSATKFRENATWNGQNMISDATGSQWHHQALYYTKSGKWILNAWSDWSGSRETYEEIDEAAAVQWLSAQQCHDDDGLKSLPSRVQSAVSAGLASLEM